MAFFSSSFFSPFKIGETVSSIICFRQVVVSIDLPKMRLFINSSCQRNGIRSIGIFYQHAAYLIFGQFTQALRSRCAYLWVQAKIQRAILFVGKPPPGLSICIEETPRSANTKSNFPNSSATLSMLAKFVRWQINTSSPYPAFLSRSSVLRIL